MKILAGFHPDIYPLSHYGYILKMSIEGENRKISEVQSSVLSKMLHLDIWLLCKRVKIQIHYVLSFWIYSIISDLKSKKPAWGDAYMT